MQTCNGLLVCVVVNVADGQQDVVHCHSAVDTGDLWHQPGCQFQRVARPQPQLRHLNANTALLHRQHSLS